MCVGGGGRDGMVWWRRGVVMGRWSCNEGGESGGMEGEGVVEGERKVEK